MTAVEPPSPEKACCEVLFLLSGKLAAPSGEAYN